MFPQNTYITHFHPIHDTMDYFQDPGLGYPLYPEINPETEDKALNWKIVTGTKLGDVWSQDSPLYIFIPNAWLKQSFLWCPRRWEVRRGLNSNHSRGFTG